ncbi:MAG: glycoside hydrolase family 95 protein [Clostridia bacterium]|nr:glycoside hydrolase family 95 protein [Clostridia bacterium]
MKKRIVSLCLALAMLFASVSGILPVMAVVTSAEGELIAGEDIPLHLYYDEEASHGVSQGFDDMSASSGSGGQWIETNLNDDWERWSIPVGNGYFGANLFGRTESERIQLTDKTLANPYRINNDSKLPCDGLNNFSETYIDFGHKSDAVSNYSRKLDIATALSTVSYVYGGVTYEREYFTSYPDNALVIRLTASSEGALSFVLRPTVPYEQEYMAVVGDRGGKEGTVTSSVEGGVGEIVLSGKMEYFDIDFYGLYRVYTTDGAITATTCVNADGDTDGTITVSGATEAYIYVTLGTDYELTSETFTAADTSKPTFSTTVEDARAKVEGYMAALEGQKEGKSLSEGYEIIKARHLADYRELFGRVTLSLDFNEADFAKTTDELLAEYKAGSGSQYLEALYFQYGRYLLIASSREGALPANLQGTWNRYNNAPWSSGYWHNINVQMNYWPAFSTNLAETFLAYADYNAAYMEKAEKGATSIIQQYNPSVLGQDGGNGWSIATGGYPNAVYGSESIGNLGFTTQLFWEYFMYTQDSDVLEQVVYPVLVSAARFITKMVKEDKDGNYLAIYTDSPEQYVNGVWYYTTGTTYAQSFAYQNNYNLLLAAKELGIDFEDTGSEDYDIFKTVLAQIDKYDPIVVGLSGQVKEFREEEKYGDLGEYTHRHISQLVGLYPGNLINGTTPAWLDAARYTLTERGDNATGWGVAHRLNLWARVQDGERAYDLLEQLLKVNTATNLWDLHPPFQIDGNLGGTAGISEMLLQSHAGYIEPLAAIPSAWASGQYTGLVARGGFEVSAKWADGVATSVNLLSKMGGSVSVKYDGITEAIVRKASGEVVDYTAKDGVITFDTKAGETYIITGFEKRVAPDKVEGLTAEGEFLSDTTLTWNASPDALYYNVYVARNSSPTYTYLGRTADTEFVYKPDALANDRLTFAVTVLDANGNESDRALAYRNPDDVSASVEDAVASVVDEKLQVAIKSNDYANKFKLYSRANSSAEWTLLEEGTYPIIILDEYSSKVEYGASVVSLFGEESEITPVSISTQGEINILDYQPSNILGNIKFDPTPYANSMIHTTAYGYPTLTDGSFNNTTGRFSTSTAANMIFNATAALRGSFLLGELRIFDFGPSDTAADYLGTALTVEVFYDGEWKTVKNYTSNAEIVGLRTKNASGVRYVSIDLSGVMAQAIRVSIPNTMSGKSISIYEIECSGIQIPDTKSYSNNLILGKDIILTDASLKHMNPASKGPSVLTDGNRSASTGADTWYTWWNQTDMQFDGTVKLGGNAYLGKLRIYDTRADKYTDYSSVGPRYVIEVCNDGEWTQLYDVTPYTATIANYREVGVRPGDTAESQWIEFDLGGVKAQAVRIYMPPKSSGNFDIREIEIDGYIDTDVNIPVYSDNLFLGNQFVPTPEAEAVIWSPHTYDRATDGISGSGNRLNSSGKNSFIDGTLAFPGIAYLETLTIDYGSYLQARSGTGLVIQTFANGVWTDALNVTYDRAYQEEVTYELGGIAAEKVRLYVPGVYPTTYGDLLAGDCITIEEIYCSGSLLAIDKEWSNNLFEGYVFEKGPTAGTIWSPNTYDKITDGVSNNDSNRFSTSGNAITDGILDFGGALVELGQMNVSFNPYNVKRCGKDFTVQAWQDGEWVTVLSHIHTEGVKTESFDLGGAKAEKVRILSSGSFDGGDCTQIYEITCTGYILPPEQKLEDENSNVLLNTPKDNIFVNNATMHTSLPDVTAAFDGNLGTRFAVSDQGAKPYSLTVMLDKPTSLYTLRIYDFRNSNDTATRSDKTTVEIYSNGIWVPVVKDQPLSFESNYTAFKLYGVETDGIRITFCNTQAGTSASIYEVTCTTGLSVTTDRTALLDAYKAIEDMDTSFEFGLDPIKELKLKERKALLMDTEARQADIDSYVAEVEAAKNKLAEGVPVTEEYGDFNSYNLSLNGDIGFNFYGDISSTALDSFTDAFVYIEYASGETEKIMLSTLPRDSAGRLVLSLNMAAAQMTDRVKMRLVLNGENAGAYIEQSVKDYAENILADPSYETANPGINNLLNAMLTYGAYAQQYFGYNTDNLASDLIELGDVTENSQISISGKASGAALSTWKLSLESEVCAKLYLDIDDGYSVGDYALTLITPSGNTSELELTMREGRGEAVINGIPAGFLNDYYTLTVKCLRDGSEITVKLSAMCYVATILNTSANENLVNLVTALKLYSVAAENYN